MKLTASLFLISFALTLLAFKCFNACSSISFLLLWSRCIFRISSNALMYLQVYQISLQVTLIETCYKNEKNEMACIIISRNIFGSFNVGWIKAGLGWAKIAIKSHNAALTLQKYTIHSFSNTDLLPTYSMSKNAATFLSRFLCLC